MSDDVTPIPTPRIDRLEAYGNSASVYTRVDSRLQFRRFEISRRNDEDSIVHTFYALNNKWLKGDDVPIDMYESSLLCDLDGDRSNGKVFLPDASILTGKAPLVLKIFVGFHTFFDDNWTQITPDTEYVCDNPAEDISEYIKTLTFKNSSPGTDSETFTMEFWYYVGDNGYVPRSITIAKELCSTVTKPLYDACIAHFDLKDETREFEYTFRNYKSADAEYERSKKLFSLAKQLMVHTKEEVRRAKKRRLENAAKLETLLEDNVVDIVDDEMISGKHSDRLIFGGKRKRE